MDKASFVTFTIQQAAMGSWFAKREHVQMECSLAEARRRLRAEAKAIRSKVGPEIRLVRNTLTREVVR